MLALGSIENSFIVSWVKLNHLKMPNSNHGISSPSVGLAESSWLLLAVGKFHKGGDGSLSQVFGCFEGGAALDKEPSIERVHK